MSESGCFHDCSVRITKPFCFFVTTIKKSSGSCRGYNFLAVGFFVDWEVLILHKLTLFLIIHSQTGKRVKPIWENNIETGKPYAKIHR